MGVKPTKITFIGFWSGAYEFTNIIIVTKNKLTNKCKEICNLHTANMDHSNKISKETRAVIYTCIYSVHFYSYNSVLNVH